MKHLILAALFLLLVSSPVLAHWEDSKGCDTALTALPDFNDFTLAYDGVSPDGRDYIHVYKHTSGSPVVEEHRTLLPPSQWKDEKTPAFHQEVLSLWLDWAGDGTFEEWFLFPRGFANCIDALHFEWNSKIQTYQLLQTGKDHI